MDIEKLIKMIKGRPGMFVGNNLNVRGVSLFIKGFLYSSIGNKSEYKIDTLFRENIDEWVRCAIEQREEIRFEEQRGYVYYIETVCENGEQEMALFFELCEEFFEKQRNLNG